MSTPLSALRNEYGSARSPSAIWTLTRCVPKRRGSRTRQRTGTPGTLIISEGTFISPVDGGYANAPGIYTDAQIAGWRKVTDAVHANGSAIFCQLCGDAHVQNLGAFAGDDGRLIFNINDFDETLRGPFEWDVKRMATSILLAGKEAGYSAGKGDVTAVSTIERGDKPELVVGRANGDIQLLSAAFDDSFGQPARTLLHVDETNQKLGRSLGSLLVYNGQLSSRFSHPSLTRHAAEQEAYIYCTVDSLVPYKDLRSRRNP